MEKNDFIVQRGDLAKWMLTIEHEDFDQQRDDFYVIVHWGMKHQTVRVNKGEMTSDEEGNWFMFLETNDMLGRLKAETHYFVPDTDCSTGIREEVDWQYIGTVSDEPHPQLCSRHVCTGGSGHVEWKRTWRGDVNTLYLNLRTKDQEPILDGEGKQLRVRKHNLI